MKVSNIGPYLRRRCDVVVDYTRHLLWCKQSKMAFTEEDKILIKVLRQEHGYGAKKCLKEFSNKGWCLSSVIKLLKKIDETGTVERKPGSGKKRTTRTVENVELVERLELKQENAPGTHRTVRQITMFLPEYFN